MDLFQNLLEHYKHLYGPGESALGALDNDILLAVNEGHSLAAYVSAFIEDHDLLFEYILEQREPTVENVYSLWCLLEKDKQMYVYDYLMKAY
jgi:hypothetical protein